MFSHGRELTFVMLTIADVTCGFIVDGTLGYDLGPNPPPYNGKAKFRQVFVCSFLWAFASFAPLSRARPDPPKPIPPPSLPFIKYYNLSEGSFGGMRECSERFGGIFVCFLMFLQNTPRGAGGMRSRGPLVAKKYSPNAHFCHCFARRHSTCVLWDL